MFRVQVAVVMLVFCGSVVPSFIVFVVLGIGGSYDVCVSKAYLFVDIVVVVYEERGTFWILLGYDGVKI